MDTDGQVTFVDDRGVSVSFPDEPRIVAWQTIVPALVELGIEPVGVIAFNDLATNPGFIDAGVDVEDLVAVSTSYGEVDIEVLAALDPDVILTYDLDGDLLQGFTDAGTQDLAEQVAPFIALDSGAPVETGIERMEELAGLMGADLSSAEHAEDVAAFDRAVEDLDAVVAERDGLQVAFGGPAPSGLFVAPIDSYPELQFYRDLGLAVTDGPQDAVVSWELVDGLDADVFMIDDRTTPEELAEADQIPTWGSIPAVAAGQAGDRLAVPPVLQPRRVRPLHRPAPPGAPVGRRRRQRSSLTSPWRPSRRDADAPVLGTTGDVRLEPDDAVVHAERLEGEEQRHVEHLLDDLGEICCITSVRASSSVVASACWYSSSRRGVLYFPALKKPVEAKRLPTVLAGSIAPFVYSRANAAVLSMYIA